MVSPGQSRRPLTVFGVVREESYVNRALVFIRTSRKQPSIRCVLLPHIYGDDGPHRVNPIESAQRGRIEAGYPSIQEKSIAGAETNSKELSKLPECYWLLGNREDQRVRVAKANSITDFP